MKVLRREPKNFLDRPDHADGRVTLRYEFPLLDIGTDDKGDAAVGVDMVGTALRIVPSGLTAEVTAWPATKFG
jgi:hypothetical protein